MRPEALTAALVLTLGAGAAVAVTAAPRVPFDVQVPLVLKALTYDRNLKTRSGEQVRIAVVSPAKASREVTEEFLSSVSSLPDRTVNGLPVTFREITVADEAGFDQALRGGRWAAAYVLPGFRADELSQVKRVCASRQVLAVAAEVDDVERGMAFGVGAAGGKPQIVVNLPNAKASGTDFDLALLRLARVIQ
jgi:hypothetical protein